MIGYLLFRILPAVAALSFLAYLLYVRLHPARKNAILAKHKHGTPAYEVYTRMYGTRFLVSWALMTFWFAFLIAFDFYRSGNPHPPAVILLLEAVVTIGTPAVAYWLWSTSKGK